MENTELQNYMATLLEAGFDPQSVLEKGYAAALYDHQFVDASPMDGRQLAANMVRDVAKALKIDHAAQVNAYEDLFTSGNTKDVTPFNEGTTI